MFNAFNATNQFFTRFVSDNHPILYFISWNVLINLLTMAIEGACVWGILFPVQITGIGLVDAVVNIAKDIILVAIIGYTIMISAYWIIGKHQHADHTDNFAHSKH